MPFFHLLIIGDMNNARVNFLHIDLVVLRKYIEKDAIDRFILGLIFVLCIYQLSNTFIEIFLEVLFHVITNEIL